MIAKGLLFCILFMLSVCSFGQNRKFINLSSKQGLSQHDILCIFQDNLGFMWFGTNDGLNRYDGYNFNVYKPKKGNSWISDRISSSVDQDVYGNIWITTTNGGVNCFIPQNEDFYIFSKAKGNFNGESPINVLCTKDSIVWISCSNKLFYARCQKSVSDMVFKEIYSNQILPKHSIPFVKEETNILYLRNCALSIAYSKNQDSIYYEIEETAQLNIMQKGNWRMSSEVKTFTDSTGTYPIPIRNNPVDFIVDRDNNCWLITSNLLYVISYQGGSTFNIEKYDFEKMGGEGLHYNKLSKIFIDRTGVIWVGTFGGGLYKHSQPLYRFSTYRNNNEKGSISNNKVRVVHSDQFGNLWIGTEGGGIDFLNGKATDYQSFVNIKKEYPFKDNNIAAISEQHIDNNHSVLWFSTIGSGVLHKIKINRNAEIETSMINHSKNDLSILFPTIMTLFYEHERLWVGSFNKGLGYINLNDNGPLSVHKISPMRHEQRLSGETVRSIFRDSYGFLWIGTNAGLNKMNENSNDLQQSTFIHYKHNENDETSIGHNYILQIFESEDNTLWIGTMGGGLQKVIRNESGMPEEFVSYNTYNELFPDDVINSIEEDSLQFLWIGTNNGLVRFDPVQETYDLYTESDGTQSTEFSEIASTKRKDGMLIFGGINGFNLFNPYRLEKETSQATARLTKIKILNKEVNTRSMTGSKKTIDRSIEYLSNISLPASQNSFSFEFSSLHFVAPEKCMYEYKLEGFDKEWISTDSKKRFANYTNIGPGKYTFRVKASNNDRVFSDNEASLNIRIKRPWYYSNFSLLLYFLLLTIIVLVFRYYSLISINKKKQLAVSEVERKREHEVNQLKFQFFTNITHELRSPLTLIKSPLDRLRKEENPNSERFNLYQLMSKNLDYLIRLIDQLLDFRKIEQNKVKLSCVYINVVSYLNEICNLFNPLAKETGITIDFISPQDKFFTWIDVNIVEKILHNLLTNAFKFTEKGGQITIILSLSDKPILNYPEGFLSIAVIDNGIGIKEEEKESIFNRFYQIHNKEVATKGVGIGLSFSLSLAKLHKGDLTLESEYNVGSTFLLRLPLGNQHLSTEQMSENTTIHIKSPNIYSPTPYLSAPKDHRDYPMDTPLILIVEDDIEINNFTCNSLSLKYRILSAVNGKEGIEKAFRKLPDLIISDIMMPVVDGIQLCQQIKNDIRTSHIPIILLTAKITDTSIIEGYNTGADIYVTKPFNMEVLESQIEAIFNNKKRILEKFRDKEIHPGSIELPSMDNQFMSKVINIIEESLSNPEFSVEQLSKDAAMSRSNFFLKMKSVCGLSPSDFLRIYRLKKAAELLLVGKNINETFALTGFNSSAHFSKAFKKYYKITPSKYKSKSIPSTNPVFQG